ncbi:DUF2125 domain-containing protein [Xanthobacter sp. V4C-4]|uniref:DUF2125 domain-containing protein n=1 Tax=Xanthobacter cornucopiae TaxID=3119924 RepID=UPI00372A87D2
MSPTDTPSKRMRSWFVIGPLAALVLLAVAWSGVWVYAANRAEHEIDAWVDREAKLGRVWNCGERRLAGFPFRFELVCTDATLETRGGDPVRITAVAAHAVAQIWAPNHIVAEFVPPARVEDRASGRAYAATWSQLQISGVGDLSGQPQRFSLAIRDPRLEEPADPSGRALLLARLLEFHVRRVPGPSGPDGLEYAAGLTGGESAVLTEAGSPGPVDLTLQGLVTAAADLRPMPLAQRLKAWAAAGGVARLDRFAVTTPQVVAAAKGELSLDIGGRLNGNLDLGFSGLNDLVKQLDRAGLVPGELAPIIGALAMVGKPATVEGRKGVTFALGFKAGTLRLGGFPVGMVPPAF